MTRLACLLMLLSAPAFASEADPSLTTPPMPEPAAAAGPQAPTAAERAVAHTLTAEPTQPERVPGDLSFSVKLGLHVGLPTVDMQVGHFYFFLAGNVGVPLLSNGQIGAFAGGPAFTFPLTKRGESMWYMDLQALINPGWISGRPFVGIGAGLGARFLHRSGFTMSFKLPMLGGAIGAGNGTAEAVAYFFLANGISLPVVALGYHF